MKKSYLSGRFAYKTDIGRVRMTNEDQALALTDVKGNVLLLVADGMGGQNKGDYASSLTIQIISEAFLKEVEYFFLVDMLYIGFLKLLETQTQKYMMKPVKIEFIKEWEQL